MWRLTTVTVLGRGHNSFLLLHKTANRDWSWRCLCRRRRLRDVPVEEAGAWSRMAGRVVWIGLREPSADLLWCIQTQPNLHALAVEDADKAHQHPKVLAFAFEASLMAGQAQ